MHIISTSSHPSGKDSKKMKSNWKLNNDNNYDNNKQYEQVVYTQPRE